jgi:hypothetical protein
MAHTIQNNFRNLGDIISYPWLTWNQPCDFPKNIDDQECAHLAHAPIDALRVSKGYDHLQGVKRNYISMPRGPNNHPLNHSISMQEVL